MERKTFKCNEAGICPVCEGEGLHWGDCSVEDNFYVTYEWTCPSCNAKGQEWYKMIFDGHDVFENGKTYNVNDNLEPRD